MRMKQLALLSLAASALAADGAAQQPGAPDTLAIEHVTVLPMDRDTAVADHTVLVAGGRIVGVGPSASARVPRSARRVDGTGRYLIPGLADMHVHVHRVEELQSYVAAGVTTVVQMNGLPRHLVWRNRVARGALPGPRIFTAGMAIGSRADETHVRVRTAAEAEELVRQQSRAGYDMIKVQSGLEWPVYQRLLQAARAARIPVVGHVVEGIGAARSLSAGQVTFEHAEMRMFDGGESRLDEGAHAIALAGTWVGTLISDREGRCRPPTQRQRRIIAALRRANVKLLAGSDAGIGPVQHGTGLHCELATLVAAGLQPYEALAAATRNAGEFARLHLKEQEPFGTVTVGARADLVLLSADPRADIGTVARPLGVVLRGVWRPR
jgi:imidazolonepropionase-like amidohydrolase